MGKLNSLMQPMVHIYSWVLVFKSFSLKCTATSQRRSFNSFSLFYIFFSHRLFFLLFLFKVSYTKKHNVLNLYHISYTLSFCYVIYYIVSKICIGGRFLDDCFYCYSRWITPAIANESLTPYKNLIKRAPETQNL